MRVSVSVCPSSVQAGEEVEGGQGREDGGKSRSGEQREESEGWGEVAARVRED
jgi:hypothetical protein